MEKLKNDSELKAYNTSEIFWHLLWKVKRKWTIGVGILALLMVFSPFFSLVVVFVYVSVIYKKAQTLFMKNFAVANGFKYLSALQFLDNLLGRLFKLGSKQVTNVIEGSYMDHSMRLFNYHYSTGGKHKRHYFFTVCEIAFEKTKFPYILLQSKTMGKHSRTDWRGRDAEISLSEPISSKFKLYTTDGYQIEVLQIFTDEFLAFLAQQAHNFSIEFADSKLYIYDDKVISNKKDLEEMYNVVRKIIDSVGPLLNRLHDDFAVLHPYYGDKKKTNELKI